MFEDDDFDDFEALDDFEELDDFELMAEANDYEEEDAYEEMEACMEGALLAESEEEEDEFLGALISAATRILPKAISVGRRVIPRLFGVAKSLVNSARRNPNIRRAARAGANVITRTAQDVAKQYARTGRVSGNFVSRRAAGHAARVLPYAVYGTRRVPALGRRRRYPYPTRRYRARPRYYRSRRMRRWY